MPQRGDGGWENAPGKPGAADVPVVCEAHLFSCTVDSEKLNSSSLCEVHHAFTLQCDPLRSLANAYHYKLSRSIVRLLYALFSLTPRSVTSLGYPLRLA